MQQLFVVNSTALDIIPDACCLCRPRPHHHSVHSVHGEQAVARLNSQDPLEVAGAGAAGWPAAGGLQRQQQCQDCQLNSSTGRQQASPPVLSVTECAACKHLHQHQPLLLLQCQHKHQHHQRCWQQASGGSIVTRRMQQCSAVVKSQAAPAAGVLCCTIRAVLCGAAVKGGFQEAGRQQGRQGRGHPGGTGVSCGI